MNVEEVKTLYNKNGLVKFTIFGLDYTIEKVDNGTKIYADLYKNKSKLYRDIDMLLNRYVIYGEELITYNNKIQNIR